MARPKTIRSVDVILIWDDSTQIILHYVFRAGWTWSDFHAALSQARHMTRQAHGRTLHTVLDFTSSPFIQPGAIYQFSRAASKLTKNYQRGQTILVSTSPILWAITQVMIRMFPHKVGHVRYVPILDEAYAVLVPSVRSEFDTQS